MNDQLDGDENPIWEGAPLEVSEQGTKVPSETLPKKRVRHFPVRKLIYGVLISAAVVGTAVASTMLFKNQEAPDTTVVINTQSLDNGTLNELTSEADGALRQQLTITPDTIFKKSVTVQDSATVDKDLTVRGTMFIQGAARLNDDLSVGKSLTVVGNTSISSNLSVNGQISAASLTVGSLTINSINLSSDLSFKGHLIPNGNSPAIRASSASGNGSVTIDGNDTAGTITIQTSSANSAGELAIITFASKFNTTPKVQLTPINVDASQLNYFATKSADFFTVNTSSPTAANKTYIFDYLVTQ